MEHSRAGIRRLLRIAIGLAVSAGFVAWSLHGKTPGRIWAELREADYWSLVPFFAILLLIHVLRTVRWGLLLAPIERVSFRRLNAASAVGLMALLLLPLRLGEFARPYLVRRPGQVSASEAMASIVVERALDSLFVAGLLVLALLGISAGSRFGWALRSGCALLAAAGTLVVLLGIAVWRFELALRAIQATVGRLAPGLSERLCGRLGGLVRGLRALPSPGSLMAILALTTLYWSSNALGTWVLAQGFGLRLTPAQAAYCVAVRAIGVTLPSGPGMVGTFQAFTQLGLAPFVTPAQQADAAAFANVLWAASFAQQVGLGLLFLGSKELLVGRRPVTLGELMRAGESLGEEE